MGLKRRGGNFTGTLRAAILRALPPGEALGKKQLLAKLRKVPTIKASNRRLTDGLAKLIEQGRVVMEGARARAKFRRK